MGGVTWYASLSVQLVNSAIWHICKPKENYNQVLSKAFLNAIFLKSNVFQSLFSYHFFCLIYWQYTGVSEIMLFWECTKTNQIEFISVCFHRLNQLTSKIMHTEESLNGGQNDPYYTRFFRNTLPEFSLLEKNEQEHENNIDQNIKSITAAAIQTIPNKYVTINPKDRSWITCNIQKLNKETPAWQWANLKDQQQLLLD